MHKHRECVLQTTRTHGQPLLKKLAGPESSATHQLTVLSAQSHEVYALVDSGASHSLLDLDAYKTLCDNPIVASDLSLKSVTGQALELIGCGEVTFSLAPGLTMTHLFHIVKNLRPYEAIIGLDFLAEPRHQIRHDLSNFLLHVRGYPIRLFDSHHSSTTAVFTHHTCGSDRQTPACQPSLGYFYPGTG